MKNNPLLMNRPMYVDTSHIQRPKPILRQEQPTAFDPADYKLIGRLCCHTNPELAKRLLDEFRATGEAALDTDLHNLMFYFLTFCRLQESQPFDFIGGLPDRRSVDRRKVFIAAAVRIYKPQSFRFPMKMRSGLPAMLCTILQLDSSHMSRIIEEVALWYNKDIDEFTGKVTDLVDKLIAAREKGYPLNQAA